MRDYGKVHTTIWASNSYRSLSEDGRVLVMYLLTCPHGTIAGAFRLPDGYACEDLQWSSERVSKGFTELFENGFANRCETTKWVWIIKHFEWNPLENPNQRKAALKVARSVPDDCGWKQDYMQDCSDFMAVDNSPQRNPSETLSEPFPNQEQEQEQEQEQKSSKAAVGKGAGPKSSADTSPPAAQSVPPPSSRGARLSKDWHLPKAWGEWVLDEYPTFTADRIRLEADKFRDHWVSKSGKDATKADWLATWRNWIRRASQDKGPPGGGSGSSAPNRQEALEARNREVARQLATGATA